YSSDIFCTIPVPPCDKKIVTYYNQQKGTSYTYGQIDSVYFNTCGKHLDVCENNYPRKDSLVQIADSYIKNYASIDDNGIDTGLPPVHWVAGGYSSYTGLLVSSSDLAAI